MNFTNSECEINTINIQIKLVLILFEYFIKLIYFVLFIYFSKVKNINFFFSYHYIYHCLNSIHISRN